MMKRSRFYNRNIMTSGLRWTPGSVLSHSSFQHQPQMMHQTTFSRKKRKARHLEQQPQLQPPQLLLVVRGCQKTLLLLLLLHQRQLSKWRRRRRNLCLKQDLPPAPIALIQSLMAVSSSGGARAANTEIHSSHTILELRPLHPWSRMT